jgi:hypothetical protein
MRVARQANLLVEELNGANGMSDIEGKAARGAVSECGQRASFNLGEGGLKVFDNGVRAAEDMDGKPEG